MKNSKQQCFSCGTSGRYLGLGVNAHELLTLWRSIPNSRLSEAFGYVCTPCFNKMLERAGGYDGVVALAEQKINSGGLAA